MVTLPPETVDTGRALASESIGIWTTVSARARVEVRMLTADATSRTCFAGLIGFSVR
jgi:hypothetical protein